MNNKLPTSSSKLLLLQRIAKYRELFRTCGENDDAVCKLVAKIEEFNYDQNILCKVLKHLNVISDYLSWKKSSAGMMKYSLDLDDEKLQYYIAIFFLNKIETFSNSTLPFNSNYVPPIKSFPLELFLKPDEVSVRKFKKNLKPCDVIFGEIIATDYKEDKDEFFVLRVINKIDDDVIVYHLNITVLLYKNEELKRRENEFQISRILQVAVMGFIENDNERIHYVTLNMEFLHSEKDSIYIENLPKKKPAVDVHALKETSKFSCYAHYLDSMNHSVQKHDLIDGIKSLGLDPYRVYSFNEEEDKLISPKGFHVGALKNESQKKESNKYLEEGNNFSQSGDIMNALSAFDLAIKHLPDNYKVFECRGLMYADAKKNKQFCDLRKASLDFAATLKVNPNAENAKRHLSKIYLITAKKLINKKRYEDAEWNLQVAVKLYKNNKKANSLLKKIKRKLLSKSSDPELDALQKVRKKLLIALDQE